MMKFKFLRVFLVPCLDMKWMKVLKGVKNNFLSKG